jgi:molybdenum cofactor cytidylyltransferase
VDNKLAVILLAAGRSRRLGQPKQLLKLEGLSLVRRAAELLLELEPEYCSVVTGAHTDEVSAELRGLPLSAEFNESWQDGMGASIACGVRRLPAGMDGVLLFLCDQWRVDAADLNRLTAAWCEDNGNIVAASGDGITGPPIIFPARLFAQLAVLEGDRGARSVIEAQQERIKLVCMENARFDLDTPEDLMSLESVDR